MELINDTFFANPNSQLHINIHSVNQITAFQLRSYHQWQVISHWHLQIKPTLTVQSTSLLRQLTAAHLSKIPHFSWNLKVQYHVYRRPPLDSILSQVNPVQTLTHQLRIHVNITLTSTAQSPKQFLLFRFPTRTSCTFFTYPMNATFPTN
jgi:hypothetical protein